MDSSRKNYLNSGDRLRRRRRARLISAFFWILFFAFISVGFYFGIRISAITINTIRVEGAHEVSIENIRNITSRNLQGDKNFFIPNNSIFFYPKEQIEKDVTKIDSRIQSVDAHFNSFSSLTVSIEERSPEALWCGVSRAQSFDCFFLDKNANIYREAPDLISGQLFRFFGTTTSAVGTSTLPMSFMDKKLFDSFMSVLKNYSKVGLPILGLEVTNDPEIIHILLEPSWYVMLTKGDDYNMAMSRVLKLVNDPTFQEKTKHSTSSIQYIDARLSNKLFFKIDSTGIASSTEYKFGTSTSSTTKKRNN